MSNDSVRRGWLNRLASDSCKKTYLFASPTFSLYRQDTVLRSPLIFSNSKTLNFIK